MTLVPGQFDDGEESAAEVLLVQQDTKINKYNNLSAEDVADNIRASLLTKPERETSQFEDAVVDVTDEEDFDDNDDDYLNYYDEEDAPATTTGASSSAAAASAASNKRMNFSHSVKNAVTKMEHMESTKRTLTTDRNDRATTEQCLDPRTRLILFKLISRGFLEQIDGCLSTGKEANVYYAKAGKAAATENANTTTADKEATVISEYAIKIYKTSILVFKDRDKYVTGEHRWRKGYCK